MVATPRRGSLISRMTSRPVHSIEKEKQVLKITRMKKTVVMFVTAALACSAMAGELVVVKDTRQYMRYRASIDKDGSCKVAVDPDHPKPGDCHEARDKAPISGEYVVRAGD